MLQILLQKQQCPILVAFASVCVLASKGHTLDGLKWWKCVPLRSGGQESQIKLWQGWAPSEALGGILSPLPRATGGGRALGVCLPLYRSNLCCSGHVTLCLCLLSLLRDAHPSHWAFPGGSVVKNLPAVQKTHEMWL